MIDRRAFMAGSVAASTVPTMLRVQSDDGFNTLLEQALADPTLLESGRNLHEGWSVYHAEQSSKAIPPHYPPSSITMPDEVLKLIVAFEVSSPTVYEARYRSAIWPKGQSGITVGIGYDVGYVSPDQLEDDWKEFISTAQISSLKRACGKIGAHAKAIQHRFPDVDIAYDAAYRQFTKQTLPRYTTMTLDHLGPNATRLSAMSLGALVSLVYNRGPSFRLVGHRYEQMRNIRYCITTKDFNRIPEEIVAMCPLWQPPHTSLPGLVARRKLEAALFTKGQRV